MTPSEREEIEKIIETDANRDIKTTVKMIEKIILTQVAKARAKALEEAAKIASELENEIWDDGQYQVTDSGRKIAEAIRNKLEKE